MSEMTAERYEDLWLTTRYTITAKPSFERCDTLVLSKNDDAVATLPVADVSAFQKLLSLVCDQRCCRENPDGTWFIIPPKSRRREE